MARRIRRRIGLMIRRNVSSLMIRRNVSLIIKHGHGEGVFVSFQTKMASERVGSLLQNFFFVG